MNNILVYGGRNFAALPWHKNNRSINRAHPLFARKQSELFFVYSSLEKELTIPDDGPNGWHLKDPETRIIAGGATGADTAAVAWACLNFIPFQEYKADWNNISRPGAMIRKRWDGNSYDAAAGMIRNQRMIDEGKPSLGIGFPGGKGTVDMKRRLIAAGIEVKEFAPGKGCE